MFLDSNIFIHLYRARDSQGRSCLALIERIGRGENAATSPMVLDEVFFVLERKIGKEEALKASRSMLRIRNLTILSIDRITCEYALEYISQGLEPHDAFHAALMKQHSIQTICTYDKDFDKIKEIKRKEP